MPRGWISPRWKSAAQRRWAIRDTIDAIKKMLKPPIDLSGDISKALWEDFAGAANWGAASRLEIGIDHPDYYNNYAQLHSVVQIGSKRNEINFNRVATQSGISQCHFCGTRIKAGSGLCPHCGGPK